jgi:hypothetical protein
VHRVCCGLRQKHLAVRSLDVHTLIGAENRSRIGGKTWKLAAGCYPGDGH